MRAHFKSESGVGLIEAMIAMLVLTVGAVGMASVFLHGMQATSSSPNDLLATQKAAEAIESVFAARDSRTLTWDQIRNVGDTGIFQKGPQPMRVPGEDGILNTADDGPIETVRYPGPDHLLGTGDDKYDPLAAFSREIKIVDVRDDLRLITVIITYPGRGTKQSYKLISYISAVA